MDKILIAWVVETVYVDRWLDQHLVILVYCRSGIILCVEGSRIEAAADPASRSSPSIRQYKGTWYVCTSVTIVCHLMDRSGSGCFSEDGSASQLPSRIWSNVTAAGVDCWEADPSLREHADPDLSIEWRTLVTDVQTYRVPLCWRIDRLDRQARSRWIDCSGFDPTTLYAQYYSGTTVN